ncbi:hypothetical protein MPH_13848 [Macrophomina phaseolina MS6]|uniref:RNase H type-1 domain-containing protein n=1 Tax=Macrophomina phaseolina (strain MS6) TaxID=1126212 RepID=K2RGE2_MACPH|nr:hypothetical protein MPH_13848 [Macrophomina phaseolina MS6]
MNSKTAWAFVAYRHGTRIQAQNGSLHKAEVFDAEIRGAAEGLTWAATNAEALQATNVVLCIDNTSVIQGIDGHTPASSQSQFTRLKSTRQELRIPVETRWCPGHMGITGNEEADQLAKAAIDLLNGEQGPASVSWTRRRNREERSRIYEAWWEEHQTPTYRHLGLKIRKGRNNELALPRQTLHRLLAERTGHGDFAEYHRRLKHERAKLTCKCGAEKAQWHFIDCRLAAGWGYPGVATRAEKLKGLLGQTGWFLFQSLVESTEVFRAGSEAPQTD